MSSDQQSEPIIDAEIVSDDYTASSSYNTQPKSKENAGSPGVFRWLGWLIALLCLSFALGVLWAPQVRDQLAVLGLVSADAPVSDADNRLAALQATYERAHQALVDDMQTLRARLDKAEAATADLASSANSDLNDQLAENPDLSDQLAPLTRRQDGFSTDLETQQQQLQDLVQSVDRLTASLARTRTADKADNPRIAALQADMAAALADMQQLRDALSRAEKKVARAEQNLVQQQSATAALASGSISANPRGRLLLALLSLRDRLSGGQAYADILSALRTDLDVLPALDQASAAKAYDQLAAFASTSVATQRRLAQSFKALVPSLLVAEDAGSWWSDLVQVRRVDRRASGRDATLNAVEAALADGDVRAAYQRLLQDVGADNRPPALQTWLDQAADHITAFDALDALQQRLMRRDLAPRNPLEAAPATGPEAAAP